MKLLKTITAAIAGVTMLAGAAAAQQGVTDTEILIGRTPRPFRSLRGLQRTRRSGGQHRLR